MRIWFLTIAWFLIGCAEEGPEFTAEDVAQNDLGVAQMGRYEYAEAEETFGAVVVRAPAWLDARVNHAIATLNRQEEGDEYVALTMLTEVLEVDPNHLRALYTSGILNLYLGEAEMAADFFRRVAEADPRDAYAAYFLGQSFLQMGDYEQAGEWLVSATELDPYLRSAYWASAQAMRRVGREDEAGELLEAYQRFAPNPAARLADFAYKKMGPKAEALAVAVDDLSPVPKPEGPLFGPPVALSTDVTDGELTLADIDGDGATDIFVSRPDGNRLFIDDSLVTDHPLAGVGSNAALWGDVDDDGVLDVVLCGSDGVTLWRSDGAGNWTRPELGVNASQACAAGALFDADHDGDLDIFTTGPEGSELYSNNRDGSFRLLGAALGLAEGVGRQVLVTDLDSDRDLDIITIGAPGAHRIWQNDRTWEYRAYDGLEGFAAADIDAVTAADIDADGRVELISLGAELVVWDAFDETRSVIGSGGSGALAVADITGDGRWELLRIEDSGISVVVPGSGEVADQIAASGLVSAVAATFDPSSGPDLVVLSAAGIGRVPAGAGRYQFIAVAPSGRSESDQMRSNGSGIGTRMKIRVAGQWSVLDAIDSHSGPGQSLVPFGVGLRGRTAADFIALDWSDGVTQSEIGLAVGQLHRISETQRQLASCPVLFVWDGTEYRFVSDVLGVGGMGFFASPGKFNPPRPFEIFLLEENTLAERNGRWLMKLTEPMEENAYLDRVSLQVFDIPQGWSMVMDERMETGSPAVTGRPIFFRESLDPVRATGANGADVTKAIATGDLVAADPGPLDHRFLGLLEENQVLTVEFAEPIDRAGPVLVAEGWVEYGYSQTVFAAWQAGRSYRPASLEARGRDGVWRMVAADFGYPAGMPRTMALPLAELPAGTDALRLTSNMEIYWDRVRVAFEEQLDVATQEVQPIVARVAKPGFAARTTAAQRVPSYDYNERSPYWDTKFLRGYYTALGDALELVTEVDSAVAIIGGGEEIHLEFAAPAAPRPGFDRRVAIDFRGWAKDMDLYTKDGETVGPLPVHAPLDETAAARREALHERYNVRFQAGF